MRSDGAPDVVPGPEVGSSADTPQGDSGADGPEACLPPNIWHYENPGCDGTALRTCGKADQDACVSATFCGCDGKDFAICEFADRPFRHRGSCQQGADAAADAQS
jgi:hypothetical protein